MYPRRRTSPQTRRGIVASGCDLLPMNFWRILGTLLGFLMYGAAVELPTSVHKSGPQPTIRGADAASLAGPRSVASVWPSERLEHRTGAQHPLGPPRPSWGILAVVGGRTVLDAGRRAPVRPLLAANAPRPCPRALWTLPFRGGPVRCLAPARPRPSRAILAALGAPRVRVGSMPSLPLSCS